MAASISRHCFHGKMGDVLRADAAVAVLLAGDADEGLDRVGNDAVEIEADFGGVDLDGDHGGERLLFDLGVFNDDVVLVARAEITVGTRARPQR